MLMGMRIPPALPPTEPGRPHPVGDKQPWDRHAPQNAFERATGEYDQYRPRYPQSTITALANLAGDGEVLDVGCGTGILTRQLMDAAPNAQVKGVEPARAMRQQALERGVNCIDATAEDTHQPAASIDLVTFAQSWHWVDAQAASAELARILKPDGAVAILFNQLDVRIEWVHRLTRIMRSGDVHRPDTPPKLGPQFTRPELTVDTFTVRMLPEPIMALARTRSSYLRSTPRNRGRMQDNLSWYLFDHLGYATEQTVTLPYYALTWTAGLL